MKIANKIIRTGALLTILAFAWGCETTTSKAALSTLMQVSPYYTPEERAPGAALGTAAQMEHEKEVAREGKNQINIYSSGAEKVAKYPEHETALKQKIKEAEAHYKLGVSYLNKNQIKEAFIEFQEAIRLNPIDKYSLNALGYIHAIFEQYDEARTYYKSAIAIDPNYSEALNNLGITYLYTKNWKKAARYFKMALKNPLYSTPEKAYSNLGYALYKKRDYVNAEKILQGALTRYPHSFQSSYVLGLVYTDFDKNLTAIELFKKALKKAPYYTEARWELAYAYYRVGDSEMAIKEFQKVAETTNDSEMKEKALKNIELLKK